MENKVCDAKTGAKVCGSFDRKSQDRGSRYGLSPSQLARYEQRGEMGPCCVEWAGFADGVAGQSCLFWGRKLTHRLRGKEVETSCRDQGRSEVPSRFGAIKERGADRCGFDIGCCVEGAIKRAREGGGCRDDHRDRKERLGERWGVRWDICR